MSSGACRTEGLCGSMATPQHRQCEWSHTGVALAVMLTFTLTLMLFGDTAEPSDGSRDAWGCRHDCCFPLEQLLC